LTLLRSSCPASFLWMNSQTIIHLADLERANT
jgi:hypothetical protein